MGHESVPTVSWVSMTMRRSCDPPELVMTRISFDWASTPLFVEVIFLIGLNRKSRPILSPFFSDLDVKRMESRGSCSGVYFGFYAFNPKLWERDPFPPADYWFIHTDKHLLCYGE